MLLHIYIKNVFCSYGVVHCYRLIEQAGKNQNRACAEIFLEEWGTSGRKRPNVSLLVHLLGKAELLRAADFIKELLQGTCRLNSGSCQTQIYLYKILI